MLQDVLKGIPQKEKYQHEPTIFSLVGPAGGAAR